MEFFRGNNFIEDEVRSLLSEKYGKQVSIKKSESIGGGCINNASLLETSEGRFFLKWNDNCPADLFVREAEGLMELKKAAGETLVVPEVISAKEENSSPGFIVLEYLEPGNSFHNSDEKLGAGLAAIHQFKGSKFGFSNNNYCGATLQDNTWKDSWAGFFRENRLSFLLNLIQKERPLPADEITLFNKLLDKINSLLPDESEPVLIHGDLWSGNYMNTARGPALIDPAAYYADREMEMGIMTMFGGFSERFYKAYNEINPLPSDWKERNKLYQLYHVLNHYYLFGGGYGRQALQITRYFL